MKVKGLKELYHAISAKRNLFGNFFFKLAILISSNTLRQEVLLEEK